MRSGFLLLMLLAAQAVQGARPWTSFAYPARFEHLSIEQGLSQGTVNAILQDRQGFLWFGTENGLNRYDGVRFTTYFEDRTRAEGLGSGWVNCLAEDQLGQLWIGTFGGGLTRLDPRTGEMRTFRYQGAALPNDSIRSLALDAAGNLWIGLDGNGIAVLTQDQLQSPTPRFEHLEPEPAKPGGLPSGSINCLFRDQGGTLWIGFHDAALCRVDSYVPGKGASFRRFAAGKGQVEAPVGVTALVEDRFGVVWIAAYGGLMSCSPDRRSFQNYPVSPGDPEGLVQGQVYRLFLDRTGMVWVGLDGGGLLRMKARTQAGEAPRFQRFQHDPQDPGSLVSNGVNGLYEDDSGVLWVATYRSGLSKLVLGTGRSREQAPLLHFAKNPARPSSLSGNLVNAIAEDRFGNLWVGTDGQGLNRATAPASPLDTLNFEHFRAQPGVPGALQDDVLIAALRDSRQQLWFGTYRQGLVRVDQAAPGSRPRFVHFLADRGLSNNFILAICEDRAGRLWLAQGQGGGLSVFDPRRQRVVRKYHVQGQELSSQSVLCLALDAHGTIWAGTMYGLNRIHPETGEVRIYRSGGPEGLAGDFIQSLLVDARGRLWLGTSGNGLGLCEVPAWDGPAPAFQRFATEAGLPENSVMAIQQDPAGRLWLSTSRTLCCFDPLTHQVQPFVWQEALRKPEFIRGSAYRDGRGELLFGSNLGFFLFQPQELEGNAIVPKVSLTDFQILNRPVSLAQRMRGEELVLGPRDSVISFEFAALHFVAPDRNTYAAMLEGLDPDWREMGNRHFITYTTLPPGQYVLRIKASNCDGLWNTEGLALKIRVLPPWWQTWWFRSIALLIIGSALLAFVRLRMRRLRILNQELEARVRLRTEQLAEQNHRLEEANLKLQEAENNKARLAAMLVHDIRSPLTAVSYALELYQMKGTLSVNHLDICQHGLQNTLAMLNDLQELYRSDAEELPLDLRAMEPELLLRQVQASHLPLCEQKGVKLELVLHESLPSLQGDIQKLERALGNLVLNALKYTEPGGSIQLDAKTLAGTGVETGLRFLLLTVSDTGQGISADVLPFIFDPYRQGSRKDINRGVGLGLAIVQRIVTAHRGRVSVRSQVGVGTSFTLFFPV